jgi:cytoskeleton protein RodZ
MMDTQPNAEITPAVSYSKPILSVGKLLKAARVAKNLSIADVAGRIKFAPRQIEALEADDFERLPELAFVRGFVRSYARLLHVDETALLNALPENSKTDAPIKQNNEVPFPTAQSARRINVLWLSAALGLAVLLIIGVFMFHDKPVGKKLTETSQSETAMVPVPEHAVSAVEIASASAVESATAEEIKDVPEAHPAANLNKSKSVQKGTGNAPVHFVFMTESWVDVKDKSGKTLLKQVNAAGTEQWIDGQAPFSVVIGNASGVRLYYEGEEVELKEFTEVEVARLILE